MTQIIINIAGRKKELTFTNTATARDFIKGASAKFGDKFKLIASPVVTLKLGDKISWHLHQFRADSRHGTVTSVLPKNDDGLVIFDAKQEDLGGNPKGDVWGYMGLIYEINGQQVKPIAPKAAQFEVVGSEEGRKPVMAAVTSGMNDIDGGAPNFKAIDEKKYAIYTGPTLVDQIADRLQAEGVEVMIRGTQHVHVLTTKTPFELVDILKPSIRPTDIQELPRRQEDDETLRKTRDKKEDSMKNAAFNLSPSHVQGQVVQEFYPEIQHELISYPNATNAPMQNPEISGDPHELGTGQAEGIGEATLVMNNEELLPGAIEDAFEGMNRIGYVSTSPAGGAGIGRDGKPQVLEGVPLRKENDIKGPMFMEEFHAQYQGIPGNALAISASTVINTKFAAAEEKKQFGLFLKKVMGEVAASFIAAFKVTSKMPMNKVPGIGEIQLAQVEQAVASSFNVVNTGSRVKYLMDKLTDSEIQDAINDAYAQGAIWHEGKEGGFVYEVFVRAETIETDSMILKYKFVTGTKDSES